MDQTYLQKQLQQEEEQKYNHSPEKNISIFKLLYENVKTLKTTANSNGQIQHIHLENTN